MLNSPGPGAAVDKEAAALAATAELGGKGEDRARVCTRPGLYHRGQHLV